VADVVLAPDGGLILVGWYHQSIDFGGWAMTCADIYSDGFVLKLKPQ
jgi:hypothetical protein